MQPRRWTTNHTPASLENILERQPINQSNYITSYSTPWIYLLRDILWRYLLRGIHWRYLLSDIPWIYLLRGILWRYPFRGTSWRYLRGIPKPCHSRKERLFSRWLKGWGVCTWLPQHLALLDDCSKSFRGQWRYTYNISIFINDKYSSAKH